MSTNKQQATRALHSANRLMEVSSIPPTPKRKSRPQIIDIEASGFGPDSYPIEVGVVLGNGLRFSKLIRPMPDWTHWDKAAEVIHGISQSQLQRYGHNPFEVAGDLNHLLNGQTVYSDAWVVDKPWLDTLFNRVGMERQFFISPIESIVSEEQLEGWHPAKQQLTPQMGKRLHRALDDAMLIQETFVLTQMQATGTGRLKA